MQLGETGFPPLMRRSWQLNFGRSVKTRLRCATSDLRIDSGRRDGISDRDDRICECCHLQRVEDEHHFVFDCPLNAAARLEFTDAVDEITRQSDPFGWRSRSWSARLKFLLNDGPGDVSPEALRVWTRIQLHFYWYLAVAYKARTAHLRT